MSSPRVIKILEGIAGQLQTLGYAGAVAKNGTTPCIRWLGRDASGKDAALIDLDGDTWTSGARRAIVTATPAGTKPTDFAAFHTQSHAAGQFADGSVSLTLYVEAPAADAAGQASAQAAFHRDVLHVLRGQLGAPVTLQVCARGSEPKVNGVNGSSTDAAWTDAGTALPGGKAVAGGI
ncbi:hypothetical protein UFOVP244_13 [uncultured Caudovirales phage]|uniref:Uncharacterized protein n=1 Tax=uncultured Caudovirales phage TaxID=2100421 RepID=A0A6J7WSB4_9CAUD|nr:hypothetical protein UFOVP244_13 [uncultured Caudovirales phage]